MPQFHNNTDEAIEQELNLLRRQADIDSYQLQQLQEFKDRLQNLKPFNIDAVPTTIITSKQADNDEQCSICFGAYEVDELVHQLPCRHCFHRECLIPWFADKSTCPLCRQKVK